MNNKELGILAISKGDHQEAINIFRRELEKEKNAGNYLGIGKAFYHVGDLLAARWAFYKVMGFEPDNGEAKDYIVRIESFKKNEIKQQRQSLFRVGEEYLEINRDGWKKFFIKGVNLGLGLPGYFPGEYAIKKGTYLKWFEQMADIGINVIRNYTVHPPSFYEALHQFNESERKIYLFQGIWYELPPDNNFYGNPFLDNLKHDIKNAVDVIYGNTSLEQRPGYANGTFDHDVSQYTAAFVFGRECESITVREFNNLKGRELKDYDGECLSINQGTPFEIWVTEICDYLQSYEYEKYRTSHPITVTNWPTLDPLYHPSESEKEKELSLQGITAVDNKGYLALQEDMESLDVAKIRSKKGNGFFATYHPYPYYPDFMNYDYLEEENPYLSYLMALKKHHGSQPIVLAEFGVPSSREVAHWNRKGWNHGGHNDTAQGEINGIMMETMLKAGMAGGAVFSWFDEWFKKNWMFYEYYVPGERKPFWFNLQDPEENYGLISTYPGYPGKRVSLSGQLNDWKEAEPLYVNREIAPIFSFTDGLDESRTFKKMMVQHDEGFLYIMIEMMGAIDFSASHYMIGLDTCCSKYGEFLLPNNTGFSVPVGLKFLIHLAGKNKSRILVCSPYDKYLNVKKGEIRPEKSNQGSWVMMHNRANNRRVSKDGRRFYPSRVFSMSNLKFGSLDTKNNYYNSLSDFYYTDRMIELRIPWALINVTDPSSKAVLWKDKDGMTKKTKGVKLLAVSYKPERDQIYAQNTGLKDNITDHLPRNLKGKSVKTYTWENWDVPIYHSYLKESYYSYGKILSEIPEFI